MANGMFTPWWWRAQFSVAGRSLFVSGIVQTCNTAAQIASAHAGLTRLCCLTEIPRPPARRSRLSPWLIQPCWGAAGDVADVRDCDVNYEAILYREAGRVIDCLIDSLINTTDTNLRLERFAHLQL